MRRVTLRLLFVLLALPLQSQEEPRLAQIVVEGLPAGSRVLSWGALEVLNGSLLVAEVEVPDGTTAFFVFDYIDGTLRARAVGPRSIPGELSAPPTHVPARRGGSEGVRVWRVDPVRLTDRSERLVSAPTLAELQAVELGRSPWPLTPPPASPLGIRHMTLDVNGAVTSECVLEPNITAAVDRMTTSGAWWVEAFGEPHLLVAVLHGGLRTDALAALRLYNRRNELVAATSPAIEVDLNRLPDLTAVDLSGDDEAELLFVPTGRAPQAPIYAFRVVRAEGGARVLSFNLCSPRMEGPDVVRVQRALVNLGFDVGRFGIDGWYGPDTRAAVIRFQRAMDMPVTGIVDDETRRRLGLP